MQKKIEKIFFDFQIIVLELVPLDTLLRRENTSHWVSVTKQSQNFRYS